VGLVGDGSPPNGGGSPEKSLDWMALKYFMDFHPNTPGLYFAGDDIAEEWNTLPHPDAVAFRGTYMPFILTSGDHASLGELVSVPVFQNTGGPIGPAEMIAFGGCPIINNFDAMTSGGPSCVVNSSYGSDGGPNGAVLIQATPNPQSTTARVVLSGFAFNNIRDDVPDPTLDRVAHLDGVLDWLDGTAIPIGVDPVAFANRLDDAYPNPFNPSTTIRYSIKDRGQVTLNIYNAAGQLVRTLVNDVQTPRAEGFDVAWDGTNNAGQSVSSGVYFYKLTAKGFVQTKKMVLLK